MKKNNNPKGFIYSFFQLLRFPLRLYLKFKLKTNVVENEAKEDEGPFIVVGNHVTNYDPLFALAYLKPLVRFVAASNNLDNRLKRLLFKLARIIPINKKNGDIRTIKQILHEVKGGNSIGIFPEGGRTWDGTTDEVIYSTAKLMKRLSLPVYNQKLSGAYHTTPLWCKTTRKGQLDIRFYKIFESDELKELTEDEIYQRLVDELHHNDYEYQRERLIPFLGQDYAEYIERVLYLCPNCQSLNQFHSKGNHFSCLSCGSTGEVTEYGFIEGDFPYDNLVDFNNYQKRQLPELIRHIDFSEEDVFVGNVQYKQYDEKRLNKELVNLIVRQDGIVIDRYGEEERYDYNEISPVSLTFENTLTFYVGDVRHQFTIEPYLHHTSILYLHDLIKIFRM